MGKFVDLKGKTFGYLTVLDRDGNSSCGKVKWLCRCRCGQEVSVVGASLVRGDTKSCGCYRREMSSSQVNSGERYGRLVTKEYIKNDGEHRSVWLCECDCGNKSYVSSYELAHGKTRSCGCYKTEKDREKMLMLVGKRFERLTVIGIGDKKGGSTRLRCKCDCGEIVNVRPESLKKRLTLSCGCYTKDRVVKLNTKHNKSRTRIYSIWASMKERCSNPNDKEAYRLYGGRGIKVCDEWKTFEPFYSWSMEHGYSDNLSIDRIDVNGNYEPSNCRWATPQEQSNNRRNTIFITYNGETKCLTDWAISTGISKRILSYRYNLGWDADRILNTPVQKRKNSTRARNSSKL